jgi:hypothetical protein
MKNLKIKPLDLIRVLAFFIIVFLTFWMIPSNLVFADDGVGTSSETTASIETTATTAAETIEQTPGSSDNPIVAETTVEEQSGATEDLSGTDGTVIIGGTTETTSSGFNGTVTNSPTPPPPNITVAGIFEGVQVLAFAGLTQLFL